MIYFLLWLICIVVGGCRFTASWPIKRQFYVALKTRYLDEPPLVNAPFWAVFVDQTSDY